MGKKNQDIIDMTSKPKYTVEAEIEWAMKIQSLGQKCISSTKRDCSKKEYDSFIKAVDEYYVDHLDNIRDNNSLLPMHILTLIQIELFKRKIKFNSFGHNMLCFPNTATLISFANNQIPCYVITISFMVDGEEFIYQDLTFSDKETHEKVYDIINDISYDNVESVIAQTILVKKGITVPKYQREYGNTYFQVIYNYKDDDLTIFTNKNYNKEHQTIYS